MRHICIISTMLLVFAQSCGAEEQQDPPSIVDYPAFVDLSSEVDAYRKTRLISAEDFAQKSREKSVVILDTRSKAAYDRIHIKGAIHLNFSDFTKEKLAQLIPDKDTCILIYCNNNVLNGGPALMAKSAPLALNIPTFINLYGYGYKNIYELQSLITLDNKHIGFEGTQVKQALSLQPEQQPGT